MINTIRSSLYDYIADLVESRSKVLDLGCGKGELLEALIKEKNVIGHGIDINEENIIECIKKGVSVFQGNIDEGLLEYRDKSYDYVILSQTLQVVHKPLFVINEMLRVGKKGIICFPNFGYWKIRLQLFFKGQMPRTKRIPYEWYNTPNIHHVTIKDFKRVCKKNGIKILKEIPLAGSQQKKNILYTVCSNLFAEDALFLIES